MTIPVLSSIEPVGRGRAAWLVDIWGVMHNGVAPFFTAVTACQAFRDTGGLVLLLSNAPRPAADVARQLERIGVPASAYDTILTPGDAAIELVQRAAAQGLRIAHLGPERDLGLYQGIGSDLVPAALCQTVVCTGLVDDKHETAATYAPVLSELAARSVPMICANPDLAVERGGRIIPCAGALAKAYEALGGTVAYAGKPHRPIYELAIERLASIAGRSVAVAELLAIGDGISTDIRGAAEFGVDAVYVASGVHLAAGATLDPAALDALFPSGTARPIGAMTALVWSPAGEKE